MHLTILSLVLAGAAAPGTPALRFTPVATGLSQITTLTPAGDGSGRLFVTEQDGQIRFLKGGQLQPGTFLDLRRLTRAGGERGLLGLAFDPKYKQNGRLYVHYTDLNGDTVLARYTARGDRADPASARVLLQVKQPYANHNGGQLAFGPDGFLYLGLGDGGSGGDPQNNGQNLNTLLGKLLRLDVRGDTLKAAPNNPFAGRQGARPEIWAYGLRNPWRFSFDRQTGDLWIADVGQNKIEEVNRQPAASRGGENYGWRLKEGRACFDPETNCDQAGLVDPVVQYDHSEGQSVTGGYMYRGAAIPALKGQYLYADFVTGRLWGARQNGGRWQATPLGQVQNPSAFGEDERGELYVAEYGGRVLKIVPR